MPRCFPKESFLELNDVALECIYLGNSRGIWKALLASMRVPSRGLKELAAFMMMLEELVEKYPESGRARAVPWGLAAGVAPA